MLFQRRWHVALLIPAALALVVAMWAGLARMGWRLPPIQIAAHGPLMISGFLGTLICLERAVALSASFERGRLAYLAPALAGMGTLALIAGLSGRLAPALIALGSLGLVAIFAWIVRRQPALFSVTMGLGAAAWLVGNGLWLAGWPFYQIVHWWIGFLVLTIAGERLELARITRPSAISQQLFGASVALFLGGIALTAFALDAGVRLLGSGEIALALWLLRHDIARRTVRQTGLPRFIAACLLAGYVWLGVGGALAVLSGGVLAGLTYDAVLHSILLGFVVSMIFGHAPIILPSITGLDVPYHRRFYAHLILLHGSLVVRIAGDLGGSMPIRRWGGLLNVVALTLFVVNLALAVRAHHKAEG